MDYKAIKYRTTATALMIITVVLTVVLAAVRTWMLAQFYNADTGYFNCGDILNAAFYAGEALCLVIGVVSLVILGKKIYITQPAPSSVSLFAGLFCGFLMFASVVLYFMDTPMDQVFKNYVVLVSIILALVSSVYFVLGITSQKIGYTAKTLLCFVVILWSMASLLGLYFDISLTINNPSKILEQLALVAVTLYFLYECRFFIEKQRPALYLAVGFIASVLLGVSVLPNLIALFFFGLDVTTGFYTQISELGIFIYILFRTASNIRNIEIKSPKV